VGGQVIISSVISRGIYIILYLLAGSDLTVGNFIHHSQVYLVNPVVVIVNCLSSEVCERNITLSSQHKCDSHNSLMRSRDIVKCLYKQ